MAFVGINIGAVTVKAVTLDGDDVRSQVVDHQGRPVDVVERIRAELPPGSHVGVSGVLGHVAEVAAIERAVREGAPDVDAVASLGGESFTVYLVRDGRIQAALAHNRCAAGSGAFFVQQIGRLGLDMDEAIARASGGRCVPLAVRCSVHCKSDITHKLNRREASASDILFTLHDSMAEKVAALLERSPRPLRRVLLIGGVSRNAALVAALRAKLPETEVRVLPRSHDFEAWGTALLTRDAPSFTSPRISVAPSLGSLPPLARAAPLVRTILPEDLGGEGTAGLILGVDAGSTTTKAVLLARGRSRVVAWDYRRTHGDPVGATRECLRSLADRVGDVEVCLVGVTGSGRELVGAYLGTPGVYNEISAHAAGSAACDPGVDTIFEIGGQDAKYVFLREGVPVDYAMNAACAAGTGSFLEESAGADLGLALDDVADVALSAERPVQFKATCAAFINSDIRTALQEGRTRKDVVAGLVYAIAQNYLGRVKGHRPVGRKVFLQGGVALNRAVACAFASLLGREVIVPPHPELLGATGVALLSLDRHRGPPAEGRTLSSLVAPELLRRGSFGCGACRMRCTIDRFEVGRRRFPFGGRCSLFEAASHGPRREAPDLVEARRRLVFAPPAAAKGPPATRGERRLRIGIPLALSTHSLYPMYATFFSALGADPVLSGVDPKGELRSNAGFCLPAQIAHGAVLDLERRGVDAVFFPHVSRMPNPAGRESYLCPVSQAGPYVVARAFPRSRLLTPVLDFSAGYEGCGALTDLAVRELGAEPVAARDAYAAAVESQRATEAAMLRLGEEALAGAVASGEPAVLLVGRSYNAYWPQASQSVGRKLASRGIVAIPADCLDLEGRGPTCWHFANVVRGAAGLARRAPNLFLVYVSNFSCTIDALTDAALSAELGSRPYLFLEIDAHTADAGVETRLEAFIDVMRSHVGSRGTPASPPRIARVAEDGRVEASSGERMSLQDPRVRVFFPAFSSFHSEAWALAARWLGLHPGGPLEISRRQLERGLRITSGRECLPLPICVGQLLEAHDSLGPGEIGGFFMVRGGAPCVLDGFLDFFQRLLKERGLVNMFMLDPSEDNEYCGLGSAALAECLTPALHTADLMVEVDETLRVVGGPGARDRLRDAWGRLVARAGSRQAFDAALQELVEELARLPRRRHPGECPKVVVTGDFFTRFSAFFMEGVHQKYAEHGIILKPVDLSELVLYSVYDGMVTTADRWGLAPSPQALLRACGNVFEPAGRDYLTRFFSLWRLSRSERSYRETFSRTGLLVSEPNDIARIFDTAAAHVSPAIYGEAIPSVGKGLEAEGAGYDGVILIGPFNCLPFRIAEAILKPLGMERGLPLIAYESDGYPVPPAFQRQVDVHVLQVLERHARRTREEPAPRPGTGFAAAVMGKLPSFR